MPTNEKHQFNLTFNGEAPEKPIEIVLREGTANDIKEPNKFRLTNLVIGSIANYLNSIQKPKNGLSFYDLETREISFFEDKNDEIGTYLEEKLKLSKHIEAFKINTQNTFNAELFQKLILANSVVFESKDYAKSLLKDLRNFEVVYKHEQKKSDDRQGNTENTSKRSLEIASGNIPQEIKIKGKLFEGLDTEIEVLLTVEIDIVNDKPAFSFYSFEYEEQVEDISRKLILEQVSKISSKVTCLQVQ